MRCAPTACGPRSTTPRSSRRQARTVLARLHAGELDLLYVAPERLMSPRVPGAAAGIRDRPLRHRRGALRLAVGTRLPSRVRRARTPARALPRRAGRRLHRHRRPRDARRRAPPPRPGRCAPLRGRLRPAQHPLHGRGEAATPRSSSSRFLQQHAGRSRHRLLPEPQAHRRGGRAAGGGRLAGRRLPRRAPRGRARARAGGLPARRDPASSSPPSPSAWASTSPTCASSCTTTCPRTSRATTRRPGGPAGTACPPKPCLLFGLADVVIARGLIEMGDNAEQQPHRAAQAQRHGRLRRGHHLPPPRAARLLRRAPRRRLRQLRRLPRSARDLRRHRRRAQGALLRLPAAASASAWGK